MSCNCSNPCSAAAGNTAACESTASALDNFIAHFFGEITKTELNGVVTWQLPCDLDVGLENNPRLQSEGLACYFLRLFQSGITGATGPQGPAGADAVFPGTDAGQASLLVAWTVDGETSADTCSCPTCTSRRCTSAWS